MLTNKGHRCDAEIKSGRVWKGCGNKAHFTIQSHIGTRLHYCKKHAANRKTPADFIPATFAKMERIK